MATKAMLQAEYGTRSKRVEMLRINLSTAYGLVLGQCTDYLRSRLEDAKNKSAEVTGGQLHAMITSSGDEPLGTDFRDL